MTDPSQRKEKKSETLEVRLPFETKQAFLTACREDGTTASEVVRESIQDYLVEREQPATQPEANPGRARTLIAMIPQPIRKKRWLAAGAGAIGVAMFTALPSAAAPDFKAAFDRLDANHDGVLTQDEFKGPIDGAKNISIRTDVRKTEIKTDDGKPADAKPKGDAKTETKQEAFAFVLNDDKDGHGAIAQEQHVIVKHIDGAGGDSKTVSFPDSADIAKMQFDRFDTNKDGKVTLAEYEAEQTQLLTNGFNRLDANKDGSLTEAEYAKIAQPMIIKIGGPDGKDVDTREIEAKVKAMTSPDKLKADFTAKDKNKDGKLSLQEYLG